MPEEQRLEEGRRPGRFRADRQGVPDSFQSLSCPLVVRIDRECPPIVEYGFAELVREVVAVGGIGERRAGESAGKAEGVCCFAKPTPCFRRLLALLRGSHSKRISAMLKCTYSVCTKAMDSHCGAV